MIFFEGWHFATSYFFLLTIYKISNNIVIKQYILYYIVMKTTLRHLSKNEKTIDINSE